MIYLIQYSQHELMSYIQKAWNIRTSKLDNVKTTLIQFEMRPSFIIIIKIALY